MRSTCWSCGWSRAGCRASGARWAWARGTELAQLRAYEPGDDVRHLDAAATARTGQPHVRLHVPERALTTWIVLDLSPSMAFGTAAAAQGRRRRGRRAGAGAARDRACRQRRRGGVRSGRADRAGPRGSKPGMIAITTCSPPASATTARPIPRRWPTRCAAARGRQAPGPGRRGLGLPRPAGLGAAAGGGRRSALGRGGRDPRPARGRAARRSAGSRWSIPRPAQRLEVDTSSSRVRERFEELERERRDALATELRRLQVTTSRSTPTATGCSSCAGCRQAKAAPADELLLPDLAAGAARGAAGAGRPAPARRRARRYALRFPAVPTSSPALGTRPDWRRHIPIALALASIAALAWRSPARMSPPRAGPRGVGGAGDSTGPARWTPTTCSPRVSRRREAPPTRSSTSFPRAPSGRGHVLERARPSGRADDRSRGRAPGDRLADGRRRHRHRRRAVGRPQPAAQADGRRPRGDRAAVRRRRQRGPGSGDSGQPRPPSRRSRSTRSRSAPRTGRYRTPIRSVRRSRSRPTRS